MLDILAHRTYRHLFFAHLVALLGTGLATIALALLAYELAGQAAGLVLGTVLAIKMMAYVTIAPVASALFYRFPRRILLVTLDSIRGMAAISLPFVTEVWQIYILIFILQSASAAFTPTFQATIPDIFEDEESYTKALALSRLAYDLENLISPLLAAALLSIVGFHWLFAGTAIGFVISALFVLSVTLPRRPPASQSTFVHRLSRGIRIFIATPRLRGLMAINLAVAASGALVIVNTVVYVQNAFGLGEQQTAIAFAMFGGGSMLVALALPRVLSHVNDRTVILAGSGIMVCGTTLTIVVEAYVVLLVVWVILGSGYAAAQIPVGRLLRRSAGIEDRSALFAAQFALSHACWLITYPLAGWLGHTAGLASMASVQTVICIIGVGIAMYVWPRHAELPVAHSHDDLPAGHPHLEHGDRLTPHSHSHPPIVDDLHGAWAGRNWSKIKID